MSEVPLYCHRMMQQTNQAPRASRQDLLTTWGGDRQDSNLDQFAIFSSGELLPHDDAADQLSVTRLTAERF